MKELTVGILFVIAGIFLAFENQETTKPTDDFSNGWFIESDYATTIGEDGIDWQNNYTYIEWDTTIIDTIMIPTDYFSDEYPEEHFYTPRYVGTGENKDGRIKVTFYLYADSSEVK